MAQHVEGHNRQYGGHRAADRDATGKADFSALKIVRLNIKVIDIIGPPFIGAQGTFHLRKKSQKKQWCSVFRKVNFQTTDETSMRICTELGHVLCV